MVLAMVVSVSIACFDGEIRGGNVYLKKVKMNFKIF
jgi:hypothetical protein